MAEQLKLITGNTNSPEEFDLLPYVMADGWKQAVANSEDSAPVDEVITLRFSGTSDDNLAATIQSLDLFLTRAQRYLSDMNTVVSVFLRAQLAGETTARQALVKDIKRGALTVTSKPIKSHFVYEYQLGFTRAPFWEALTALDYVATIDCLGGLHDLDATDVVGDTYARPSELGFFGKNGGGGPLTRFWVGFRSDRYGTPAEFEPIWELELGDAGTDTATSTAEDSTSNPASGSSPKMMRCTFSTNALLVERVRIKAYDVSNANYNEQRGTYLVLGRFKCTDGSTSVRVKLMSGFSGTTQWRSNPRVLVNGNTWNIYELGSVQIPQVARGDTTTLIAESTLRLDAERISGAGSFDMDCLLLVPTAEGGATINGGQVVYVSGAVGQSVIVNQWDDGTVFSYGTKTGELGPYYNDIIATVSLGVPTGNAYMVLTAARSTSSVLTDQCLYSLQPITRWFSLRGAE